MSRIKLRVWTGVTMMYINEVNNSPVVIRFGPDGSLVEENGGEIMQFTGLTDKNGVDIYEGDIIDSGSGNGPVTYTDYGYVIERGKFPGQEKQATMPLAIPYKVEVIGNIYENPELLTEQK